MPISPKSLCDFPVEDLTTNSSTTFDLFIKVSGEPSLYAPKPYFWSQGELDRLKKNGHGNLLYDTTDQIEVDTYRKISKLPAILLQGPPAERLANLTSAGAELTRVLYLYPLSQTSLERASFIANQMVDAVNEDPTCVAALGSLHRHDDYTYFHSARVAAYSLAIAMEMSLTNTQQLQDLSLGCLLHDIGKSKIDINIINKPDKLSPDEWIEMRKHPVYGEESVANAQLSVVHHNIILHHHERLDGTGYPFALGKGELIEEVKIAMFADVYDALTTNRSYQSKRNHYEALSLIRERLLSGKLDQSSYQAMVSLLNRLGHD